MSDAFAPRILRGDGALAPSYRATFVELQNDPSQHLELYGIAPSFSVLAARLADRERHRCSRAIDRAALTGGLEGPLDHDRSTPSQWRRSPARRAAVLAVEQILRCDRLIEERFVDHQFDSRTRNALQRFRAMHALPMKGPVDEATLATLVEDSRELDFRAVLRTLRQRVVDATGLIEDGSAAGVRGRVLGRRLDDSSLAVVPVADDSSVQAAPDRISIATEAAARELGWTSADDFVGKKDLTSGWIELSLPAPPPYHRAHMELRAYVDLGSATRRPTLTLFAEHGGHDIALVRWPTTKGGWQREKLAGGAIVRRDKRSPAGQFVWRDVVAAPAWLPPPTTPDDELTRWSGGRLQVREATLGPSYRSAYGLVMLVHHRRSGSAFGDQRFFDTGVRSHGSGNYGSVLSDHGRSHGCHRLLNNHAIRLGTFLLHHRDHVTVGDVPVKYERVVRSGTSQRVIRRASRGFVFQLTPAVPVEVGSGTVLGAQRCPV